MRKFSYLEDYDIISTTINGYILQIYNEIKLLMEIDNNPIYKNSLLLIEEFKNKYPDISFVSSLILDDLLKPENVEYCFKYGKYPEGASDVGIKFETDLKKIFVLEDELRLIALKAWQTGLTNFNEIENGEDFMVVGHASHNLPGTKDCLNYRSKVFTPQYLSCSLFSDNELNSFNSIKTVFMVDVNDANYISASSSDSVTADLSTPSFETLKEIKVDGDSHFIKVGYIYTKDKAVTPISTPKLIERLSVERELQQNGEMFSYKKSLTNEIVLDRTTTKVTGALLISNGCDLLIDEYLRFRRFNIKFKCLNKGLYRLKNGLQEYTSEEFKDFMVALEKLEKYIKYNNLSSSVLLDYYDDVVLPMKYSDEITSIIKNKILEFVDMPTLGN